MHHKAEKKLSLHYHRSTELEPTLELTQVLFSKSYQKHGNFRFTESLCGYIGQMRFEINDAEDCISFYCPWKKDKIAELRVEAT